MKPVSILFAVSVLLNAGLFGVVLFLLLQGTPEIKNGRYGVLKKDIEIGRFNKNKAIFRLPKGLVVRDSSATGAGWFEPNRFRLVITSDKADLVDYSINQKEYEQKDGEYYSADMNK